MAEILIGTSGYAYHEWVGPVYPSGTKPEAYLQSYAQFFPTVELNFSYYRMPNAGQLSRIRDQGGSSLVFTVKANDALTHRVDPSAWRKASAEFRSALEPLVESGCLAAVLFQFPYSFHYDVDQRRYLDLLLREYTEFPSAVEFRHKAWYNNRVIDEFRKRAVALVALDMPGLPGLPPLMDLCTAPLAYLRLHGRNSEQWWGSDSASRYDYCYSDQELAVIGERVKALAKRSEKLLVYFNNHRRGQAVQNGQQLQTLLKNAGLLS